MIFNRDVVLHFHNCLPFKTNIRFSRNPQQCLIACFPFTTISRLCILHVLSEGYFIKLIHHPKCQNSKWLGRLRKVRAGSKEANHFVTDGVLCLPTTKAWFLNCAPCLPECEIVNGFCILIGVVARSPTDSITLRGKLNEKPKEGLNEGS